MDRVRAKTLTRARVLQLGLVVFLLGAIGYWGFLAGGLNEPFAGIASAGILVFVVLAWIGSYLLRVVTGKMTFIEQRKRYRDAYEKLTETELSKRFDALSEEEQIRLMEDLQGGSSSNKTSD